MSSLKGPHQRIIQPLLRNARGYRKSVGQYGGGGRCSVNDTTVAIFGATGFLGRYMTNQLGRTGTPCYVANRGCEMDVRRTKVQFDLGQVVFPFYDPADEESMRMAMGNADTVVNLIGKYYETKHIVFQRQEDGSISRVNSSFKNVNVDVAARLARAAKSAGVRNFVHVSALAQDMDSPSMWAKTKAQGEKAVREAFPEATIVRPAKLFGHEDRLLMWMANIGTKLSFIPMINHGSNLIQPIDARNVAEVMMTIIDDPDDVDYRGKIVELAGKTEFSWKEIADFVLDTTYRTHSIELNNMTMEKMQLWGRFLDQFPTPYWNVDEGIQMGTNVVLKPDTKALTIADFGIDPYKLEEVGITLLQRFKRIQHFGMAKGYHL